MLMARVVSDLANRTPGKEAVAMESFAKALMMVRHFVSADIWLFREDQCRDAELLLLMDLFLPLNWFPCVFFYKVLSFFLTY